MSGEIVRIAMWSGPRNISTAMMRAFGARADTIVYDEPFYAAFLAASGKDHPMREAVIAAGPTDPADVVTRMLAPLPDGRTVFYQKHMPHHMLADFFGPWLDALQHAFLIRHPAKVLASYQRKWADVTLRDIGFVQQHALFERLAERTGAPPPVLDSDAVLRDPAGQLTALCHRLAIAFDPAMLSWSPGARPSDGVWAAHWYGAVNRSSGFAAPQPAVQLEDLEPSLRGVAEAAMPFYQALARHQIAIAAV